MQRDPGHRSHGERSSVRDASILPQFLQLMKHLPHATLLAVLFCILPVLRAADTKAKSPPAAAASSASSLVGEYLGEWKASGEATGELRIKLKQDGTTWAAEAVFTFEKADVPTQMKTVEIDGTKVVFVFDWQIQGTPGQSKLTGELKADTLQGTFETKSPEGPSKGTWKVTRK
jgi:hypothetical protein